MEFDVLFLAPLFGNVSLDLALTVMASHRADVVPVVPGSDLQTHVPARLVHLVGEDRPPVLRWRDDMVQQGGDIMAAVDVLTHLPKVSQLDAASRREWDP